MLFNFELLPLGVPLSFPLEEDDGLVSLPFPLPSLLKSLLFDFELPRLGLSLPFPLERDDRLLFDDVEVPLPLPLDEPAAAIETRRNAMTSMNLFIITDVCL